LGHQPPGHLFVNGFRIRGINALERFLYASIHPKGLVNDEVDPVDS
jgi:hypothetical protein